MTFAVHVGDPGTIGETKVYSDDRARYEFLAGGVLLVVDEEGRKRHYSPSQWTFLHDPPEERRRW